MTDYTKSTNFLAKDSLPETDSGKIIKGSEFDTEFNALQTSIATKADKASPAFTGVPTAPTASVGTNTTQLATTEYVISAVDTARTYSNLQTFKDTAFAVVDNSDTSKKLALELSGVTTATTRTLTVPDKNGTIAVTSDISLADPLNAASNTVVSGSYAVTSSATITITATNTYTAGQTVYIQFTNTSGSSLTNGNFSVVSATGSSFTITYGSSVTSAGTCIVTRYGSIALATSADLSTRTDTLRAVTSSNLVITSGTSQATTSGTSVTFTNIPSWVKRITFELAGVSWTTGTTAPMLQLGTSAGITTTGYFSTGTLGANTSRTDTGLLFSSTLSTSAALQWWGAGTLTLVDLATNSWAWTATVIMSNVGATSSGIGWGGGGIALSGPLTQLKFFTLGGSDIFDNGLVNIIYE